MAFVHRLRHPVDRRALEERLIGVRCRGDDGVEPVREFREVGPCAARKVQARRRKCAVGGALFLRLGDDAVQGAGDERRRRGFVDVTLDEHLVGSLGRLVRGVGGKELALQLSRDERTSGRDERDKRQERAETDQPVPVEKSTGRLRQQFRRLRSLRAFLSDQAPGTAARGSRLHFFRGPARLAGSTCSRRNGGR